MNEFIAVMVLLIAGLQIMALMVLCTISNEAVKIRTLLAIIAAGKGVDDKNRNEKRN